MNMINNLSYVTAQGQNLSGEVFEKNALNKLTT